MSIIKQFKAWPLLKKFEENVKDLLSDLRSAFFFKENKFSGVCIYSFEHEALSNSITLDGPIRVANEIGAIKSGERFV